MKTRLVAPFSRSVGPTNDSLQSHGVRRFSSGGGRAARLIFRVLRETISATVLMVDPEKVRETLELPEK